MAAHFHLTFAGYQIVYKNVKKNLSPAREHDVTARLLDNPLPIGINHPLSPFPAIPFLDDEEDGQSATEDIAEYGDHISRPKRNHERDAGQHQNDSH